MKQNEDVHERRLVRSLQTYWPTLKQDTSMTLNSSTTAYNCTKTCENSYDGDSWLLCAVLLAYTLIFLIIIMAIIWLKRCQTIKRSIRRLQNAQQQAKPRSFAETDPLEQSSESEQIITIQLEQDASEFMPSTTLASPSFNKADITMQQLIKSGKEGMLYKAKMTRGTIRGHTMFTCKIYKDAAKHEQVQTEVRIMRNLNTHLNLLQLLDWDITDVPYMLIMENAEHGSLRTFVRLNKERLCKDAELQHRFTIALYHIAQALDHLHSKMILHCNLALRNIMVHRFPHEVKVAEFGLARDIMRGQSLSGSCKNTKRIPFRWYPPEYFKHDFYEFKGDIWAFGIVIWEMQTFGTVPYPDLKTSEEVVRYICTGRKVRDPEECRPEMLQMMTECWQEPYIMRPSFLDIVKVLEKILENDRDYVNIESSTFIVAVESEDGD
ncbi:fibroblast growth factor receptor homolog 1-like isoform X1 [Hemibagrus wyckioides]|uniref:fibroblast growth factor receptor homolog 1-like isoform X1 n=1 Tax=Hemibagrus wyckioides TaxID=337641 RepID=UPI00266BA463|nr:fibroblast growth factor receptor homolog 1-like isoform X1 [Hemibagrus wyckioides]